MGAGNKMKQPKMLDNKAQGRVIDELRTGIHYGARLFVVSAFFV